MAMPTTPLSPPPILPCSPSPTPTTPLEISQQLQRVEILHQQLKAEAQRAQEFLTKLRRGELEAHPQAQLHSGQQQRDRDNVERRQLPDEEDVGRDHGLCTCSCPHHPPLPPSSGISRMATSVENRNSFSTYKDMTMPPLTLPTRVDEREVRDLEKRVRGLEGRVRGFEGLPPDREMALLEVERLRRELEGLARRREGLFEGLVCDDIMRLGGGDSTSQSRENGSEMKVMPKDRQRIYTNLAKGRGRQAARGRKRG